MASELACSNCQLELVAIEVLYIAGSDNHVVIEHAFPGDECPKCKRVYFARHWADALDALAKRAPRGFRILPEWGFHSVRELEVFSFIQNASREVRVTRREAGLELRYGPQSRFFRSAANYFTKLDLADHGLDLCPTIRIRPGPPYTPRQRRAAAVLIAKVQLHVVDCEEHDAAHRLLRTVLRWKRDSDGRALTLASALLNGSHPGKLVNAYRLLELALEALLDAEIGRKRHDVAVDDSDFAELATTYKADLKTRLRRRIEALDVAPTGILKEFWANLRPGEAFDEKAVFEAIANFRNRHVHRPDESDDSSLPWDSPPFEKVSSTLMELILFILENDLGGAHR